MTLRTDVERDTVLNLLLTVMDDLNCVVVKNDRDFTIGTQFFIITNKCNNNIIAKLSLSDEELVRNVYPIDMHIFLKLREFYRMNKDKFEDVNDRSTLL